MLTDSLLVALILFAAAFTQSAMGFGLALVSMPLLVPVIGVRTATPLVAVIGLLVQIPVLIRYRGALNWREIARLSSMVLVGIPIGVVALKTLDPEIVTTILGVIVIIYALYALLTPDLPRLSGKWWGYPAGFVAGLLSGAYSTGGPPLIIYADFSRWDRDQFKGNLQGIFSIAAFMQIASHRVAGNLTPTLWQSVLWALPGVVLGVPVGMSLDRFLQQDIFRKIVLVLLIVLGVRLIF